MGIRIPDSMDVGNVQKTYFTVVSVFLLVSFSCQHVAKGSIISPRIINFYIMFLINFLCFTDEVRTLSYFLYDFFIQFASVSHHSCFDLTASKQCRITLRFVFIKITQSRYSFSSSEFGSLSNLLSRNSKWNKKLTRVCF